MDSSLSPNPKEVKQVTTSDLMFTSSFKRCVLLHKGPSFPLFFDYEIAELCALLCHKTKHNSSFVVTPSLISVRFWNFKNGGSLKVRFLAKNQHATKEKSLKNSYD